MSIWIKFCGIVRPEDFHYALKLDINAVGIIAIPHSPRHLNESELRDLSKLERAQTQLVLVLENPQESFVHRMIDIVRPDLLQFHGNETSDFAESFSIPYIKATRNSGFVGIFNQHEKAYSYLADTPDISGVLTDVNHLIIAGGLDSYNVGERIRQHLPWGVDVSRGIERTPREKDHYKMTEFVNAVRTANN